MFRVLHVSPSIAVGYGGPTASLLGYAEAARRQGIDVSIAAPRPGAQDLARFRNQLNAQVETFRAIGRGAFVTSPALWRWLRQHGGEYDAIHVHGLMNPVSSTTIRLAVRRAWSVVVRPFGMLSPYTFTHRRRLMKQLYFALVEAPNLRRVDALHFTTVGEQRDAQWHGLDLVPQFVIPPPYVATSADGAYERIDARSDEPGRAPRVLFIGRLHPVKNLEALIDAWPRVRGALPGATLTIAGAGPPSYTAKLRSRTAAIGMTPHIRFHGFADERAKQELLAHASICVLPSLHENFGVSALEAAHAGIPLVVSTAVHLADFVRHHKLGIVSTCRAENLADAIISASTDSDLRLRCRSHGRDEVMRVFGPARIGEQLLAMYRGIKHG